MKNISTKRKITLTVTLVFIVYLLMEFLAFTGYSILDKSFFSWTAFQAERQEVITGDAQEKLRHSLKKKDEKKSAKKEKKKKAPVIEDIHPYLGFVYRKNRPDSSNFGFIDRRVVDNPNAPVTRKSEDNFIVGIFGGSFAYGASITSTEDYFEEKLKQLPPLKDKNIIIHTVALGGYKQPQQLIALNYFLSLGAHFDLVINIDGFNEVALPPYENTPKNVYPFFPRMWWMRVGRINSPDVLTRIGKISVAKEDRVQLAELFEEIPFRYSIILNLIWKFADKNQEKEIKQMEGDLTRFKAVENAQMKYMATGPSFSYDTEEELFKDLAKVWSTSSRQMSFITQANNIDYFHYLQPNQYVANSKPMNDEEREIGWLDGHAYKEGVEKGYKHLIEEGKGLVAAGVPFHDLTMMFADNEEVLYSDACCHLNEKGYNFIIDRIVDDITLKYTEGDLLSIKNRYKK